MMKTTGTGPSVGTAIYGLVTKFTFNPLQGSGCQSGSRFPGHRHKSLDTALSGIAVPLIFQIAGTHHWLRYTCALIQRIEQRLADGTRVRVLINGVNSDNGIAFRLNQVITPVAAGWNQFGFIHRVFHRRILTCSNEIV